MSEVLQLNLEGDHYAMGCQHGRQAVELRPLISQAMELRFRQIEEEGPDARFRALLWETRDSVAEHAPWLLALIKGQADTLELDYDQLLDYSLQSYLRDALVTRLPPADEACSTWAAGGSDVIGGQPILTKNRDYRLEHLALQIVVHAVPQNGHPYLYSSSAGSPGVFCAGINRAGLAVADTHVSSRDLGPGLPDFALMMEILEKHDTVASALDYLRAVPRLGRNNLILADAGGHLAVFEIGHSRFGLRESCEGVLVNTNHFVTPELQGAYVETGEPSSRGSSFYRYRKIAAALKSRRGRIDLQFAKELMAYHDGPLASICRHPMEGEDTATISSSIFLPACRRMLFRHGLPCQGAYVVYGWDRSSTDRSRALRLASQSGRGMCRDDRGEKVDQGK